jgi:transposase
MIDKRTIFEIHRLKNFGLSDREIGRQLLIDRGTVAKYLQEPDRPRSTPARRPSKLDPYREQISDMIKQFPFIKAPVVLQRIREKGFDGEITIVRALLRELRGNGCRREPFIRIESEPGRQMQVDWGHFNSLEYGNAKRKLYALAVVESHSRMLFVFFTHSQKQEYFHMGLLEAFKYLGGTPEEIVVDNMLTAVTERVGSMVRFNEAFLDFLRPLKITPYACNVRAPHEKGKVENCIKYIRQNFWPLRNFTSLADTQEQMLQWLDNTANVRVHETTGERPIDRLRQDCLRPLPDFLTDTREIFSPLVHKSFTIRFDSNSYTVPPWAIGKKVVAKAGLDTVQIFYKDKKITTHARCWGKKQYIELPIHREQVRKMRKRLLRDRQIAVFLSLGQTAVDYLERLVDARQPIKKTVALLLRLKDEYGESSLLYALGKAMERKLYGAEYIRNILYQEMTPVTSHQPVRLKKEALNEIRLQCPSLAEYDALALKRRK